MSQYATLSLVVLCAFLASVTCSSHPASSLTLASRATYPSNPASRPPQYDHNIHNTKTTCKCTHVNSTKGAYVPSKSVLYVDSIKENIPGSGVDVESAHFKAGMCSLDAITTNTVTSAAAHMTINNATFSRTLGLSLARGTLTAPNGVFTTIQAPVGSFSTLSNGGSILTIAGPLFVEDTLTVGPVACNISSTISAFGPSVTTPRMNIREIISTRLYTSHIYPSTTSRVRMDSLRPDSIRVGSISTRSEAYITIRPYLNVVGGLCVGQSACNSATAINKLSSSAVILTENGRSLSTVFTRIGNTVKMSWTRLIITCPVTTPIRFTLPDTTLAPKNSFASTVALVPGGQVATGIIYITSGTGTITFAPAPYVPGNPTGGTWQCGGTMMLLSGSVTYITA